MSDIDDVERFPDPIDRASAEEARQNAAALAHNTAALHQVQQPRADGTYEFEDCEDCGNEIGAERLRLAPANHLCVECATAEEKRKKRGLPRFVNY